MVPKLHERVARVSLSASTVGGCTFSFSLYIDVLVGTSVQLFIVPSSLGGTFTAQVDGSTADTLTSKSSGAAQDSCVPGAGKVSFSLC